MALVTVGVPVYNGAALLEQCLTCLRDQTYRDIEVLIFDNCSTDATPEIAQRFCAEDHRFRLHRQPENKGGMPNFREVLEAAKTPFFMWRAHDDISDLNYIETLLTLLLEHPDRDIAVPRVVSAFPDGRIKRIRSVSRLIGKGTEIDRLAQLFLTHENWFYGLYRREVLTPILHEIIADFPFEWGADNLALFMLGFDGKIIGSNATTFYQYLRFPNRAKPGSSVHTKIERGRLFASFAHRHVNRRVSNPVKRWYNHLLTAYFVHKRGLSISKRLRHSFYNLGLLKPQTKLVERVNRE